MLGRRQDPQDPEAGVCVVWDKDHGGTRACGERGQEPPPGWPGGFCPWAARQTVTVSPEKGVGKEADTESLPALDPHHGAWVSPF